VDARAAVALELDLAMRDLGRPRPRAPVAQERGADDRAHDAPLQAGRLNF
jgi:hypothetical protein